MTIFARTPSPRRCFPILPQYDLPAWRGTPIGTISTSRFRLMARRSNRRKTPNALTELRRILKEADLASYDLPWLVHLTGDVHQPLHCTSRFTKPQPHGDQGGNLV